jgi:hypothetical protein
MSSDFTFLNERDTGRTNGRFLHSTSPILAGGQGEDERAATGGIALGPDSAAMPLDPLPGKRQAQTGSIPFRHARVVGPVEFLEDMRQVGFRNPAAGVGDQWTRTRAEPQP